MSTSRGVLTRGDREARKMNAIPAQWVEEDRKERRRSLVARAVCAMFVSGMGVLPWVLFGLRDQIPGFLD